MLVGGQINENYANMKFIILPLNVTFEQFSLSLTRSMVCVGAKLPYFTY